MKTLQFCFLKVTTSKGGVTNPTPIYEKYCTDVWQFFQKCVVLRKYLCYYFRIPFITRVYESSSHIFCFLCFSFIFAGVINLSLTDHIYDCMSNKTNLLQDMIRVHIPDFYSSGFWSFPWVTRVRLDSYYESQESILNLQIRTIIISSDAKFYRLKFSTFFIQCYELVHCIKLLCYSTSNQSTWTLTSAHRFAQHMPLTGCQLHFLQVT